MKLFLDCSYENFRPLSATRKTYARTPALKADGTPDGIHGVVIGASGAPDHPQRLEKIIGERLLKGPTCHFVILRDGTILQQTPISNVVWHIGPSTAVLGGEVFGTNSEEDLGISPVTISIHLDNVGPLRPSGMGGMIDRMGHPFTYHKDVVGGGVQVFNGEPFERYTDKQLDALLTLVEELIEEVPGLKDSECWIAASSASPSLRKDPYPTFDWDSFRGYIDFIGLGTEPLPEEP